MDIQIQESFSTHKVTLKSIYDGYRYPSPARALNYIVSKFEGAHITIDKQRVNSITITMRCGDTMFQTIKLHFVKDMGASFLWKERKVNNR